MATRCKRRSGWRRARQGADRAFGLYARTGDGAGFPTPRHALRTADAPWFSADGPLSKVGPAIGWPPRRTTTAWRDRHLLRVGTQAEFAANPEFVHELTHTARRSRSIPKWHTRQRLGHGH
ncbi:MAG: hypothetical protein R2911_25040 [Caldilineaceae bacterium]